MNINPFLGNMLTLNLPLLLDKEYGVHAFLVRIRDEDGSISAHVRIKDCGHKQGLEGVDNGRIWFDGVRVTNIRCSLTAFSHCLIIETKVRIPRENLLNRYGEVTPTGEYTTPIAHPGERFNTMLEGLVGGRVAVASMAVQLSKLGLLIATKYASNRLQFGPSKDKEVPILDYLSTQRRLIPFIATTFALQFGMNYTKLRFEKRTRSQMF
jgi:acyl-CoA oxidase